jgi:hypothetical protein
MGFLAGDERAQRRRHGGCRRAGTGDKLVMGCIDHVIGERERARSRVAEI